MSQEEFGVAIQRDGVAVDQNYISRIENNRGNLGPDVQERIEKRFNVKKQWLNDGIGEVFKEPINPERQERIKSAIKPVPPISAKGGNLTWVSIRDLGVFLRTNGEASSLPRTPFLLLNSGAYAFEVADSAMLPDYTMGMYVICTALDSMWDMLVDRVYFIQTNSHMKLAKFTGFDKQLVNFIQSANGREFALPAEDISNVYHIEFKLVRA